MSIEPYSECPCGSGKKVKWCCAKIGPIVQTMNDLLTAKQYDNFGKYVEKQIAEAAGQRNLQMYLKAMKAQVDVMGEGGGSDDPRLTAVAEEYPEFGLPHDLIGDIASQERDYAASLAHLKLANARYPAEATQTRARLLVRIAVSEAALGRPLAAWAAAQMALKTSPGLKEAVALLEEMNERELLPRQIRGGLRLRAPDDFAVFNEDRRAKWDKALSGERDWQLEDARDLFAALSQDDSQDLGAWYNLGVVEAWMGRNLEAIEAFDYYVRHESDAEAAAAAWVIAETLRFGAGAESACDGELHLAAYRITDEAQFSELFKSWKRLVVLQRQEGSPVLLVVDRDYEKQPAGPLVIGGKPRVMAMMSIVGPGSLVLQTSNETRAKEIKQEFEGRFGQTVELVGSELQACDRFALDFEAFSGLATDEEDAKERVAHYYENDWIARPLKALDGVSPQDAAGSSMLRKKLEGVIRFRETHPSAEMYDFNRLRNKLGLMSLIPRDTKAGDSPLDLAAFSAAQLAELDPASLDDAKLTEAYRAAGTLDVPATALRFGMEMTKREGLASATEMTPVFRRLIADRLERRKIGDAVEILARARDYDAKHYGGKAAGEWTVQEARCAYADGKPERAATLLKELAGKGSQELERVAQGAELALREGAYPLAKELAQQGLTRAQERRARDLQDQFRELLAEASARSK
jgi:hypothetical protein